MSGAYGPVSLSKIQTVISRFVIWSLCFCIGILAILLIPVFIDLAVIFIFESAREKRSNINGI